MSDEKNCCQIRHVVSSTGICAFGFVATVTAFITGALCPHCMHVLYKLGGSDIQVSVASCLISGVAFFVNCLLAIGIRNESPLLLLIWILVMFILWQLHLILLVCTFIFNLTSAEDKCVSHCSLRLIGLVCLQVLWAAMLLMVGRHWYALCEDFYVQEYGSRPTTMSRRLRTISHRRRTNTNVSTRMPAVLQHIER